MRTRNLGNCFIVTNGRTKRKLSDLTSEETSDIFFIGDLDEEDEDGQSVIDSIKNFIRKLEKTQVVCFSLAT